MDDTNCLKMNDSKAEFILFGSRQELQKVSTNTPIVNSTLIKSSEHIKYLGVHLDKISALNNI